MVKLSRRQTLGAMASAVPLAASSTMLSRIAMAAGSEPIKVGWLVALTGANSAPGIGFDRGIHYAADKINAAGGIMGRQVQIVTRDTQGDPTKAVNAALELINQEKVVCTIGPTNSGEGLATTPLIARYKMPSFVYGVVDQLIDARKYPFAYRVLPSNKQWTLAGQNYALKTLGLKKVGVIGDATGYGTATVELAKKELQDAGAEIAYSALIDANQTDVSTDMQKAQAAGSQALMIWSDSAGLNSRLMNARGDMGWDVPMIGHPAMGAGSVKALLKKPENWDKVYIIGYRSTSYDKDGNLPKRTQAFLDEVKKTVKVDDTTLWWVAAGFDSINLLKLAVEKGGSTDHDAIKKALEAPKAIDGVFGDYSYTAEQHNGYPVDEIAMNAANSFRNGAYDLAPGYS